MSINLKEIFSKKNLTNNLSLKIASLVIAIVLWFIVVGITDPTVSSTYRNVQVKLVNASIITNNEKTLEVVDDSNILATVTVKAPRSVIRELGNSSENISAIADLTKLSSDGTSIPIELSTVKYNDKVESIKASENSVYVNIEKKLTIQLPLVTTTSGSIESGYVVGEIVPSQNQVKISGPASVIEKINKAAINVEIAGFTDNISTLSDIVLFDSNGEEVSLHNLELNASSVRVNVEILATKRVPISYSVMGSPAEGYAATGEVECYPETLVVAGSKADINKIESIKIPSAELNLTGQTDNLVAVLDASDYLPANVKLVESAYNGRVTITAFVEKYIEQTYATYLNSIKVDYVPVGYEAEIVSESDSVSFVLIGLAKDLEKVQMSQMDVRVDFSDYALSTGIEELSEGIYTLSLIMDLPDGVEMVEPVKLLVKLTEQAIIEEKAAE